MTATKAGPWVLAAMIFAVGMTFIDMTIVSIAIPDIQKGLHLSETGMQWVVNGYLLALAATFALGGRLGDTFGKRRMVTLGIIIFAVAWIIAFRVIQGIGAALMIPAALALVVSAYSVEQRGRALAIFFGITGALTAVGPIAGGYLVQIDWRAIFWINIPIAIIALVLIVIAKPDNDPAPAPIDYRGAALITGGIGLSVLGLQQSSDWGWGDPKTIASLIIGTLLIVAFVRHELRTTSPLMRVKIFTNKAFAADNVVLFLLMIVFIPLFFFASTYAQLVLGQTSSEAGLYIMYFFIGFAVSTQIGGRILDKTGARPTIIVGSIIGAVGFYLWASKMTDFSVNDQMWSIIIAGFGVGLILGPANTDAINRAPADSYAEATGITQTVRNYGAALGIAILGTILITQNKANIEDNLGKLGIPKAQTDQIASDVVSGAQHVGTGGSGQAIFRGIQTSYAQSTQTIFYVMSGVLALIFIYSLIFVPRGKVDEVVATGTYDTDVDRQSASADSPSS